MNFSYSQFFLKVYSHLFAIEVGKDNYMNTYFVSKKNGVGNNNRKRRWVIYDGEIEASKVPPEWNAWLHHVVDDIPKKISRKPKWLKKHIPNLTGTKLAKKPKNLKIKEKVNNTYSLWKPDE